MSVTLYEEFITIDKVFTVILMVGFGKKLSKYCLFIFNFFLVNFNVAQPLDYNSIFYNNNDNNCDCFSLMLLKLSCQLAVAPMVSRLLL